MEEPVQNNNIHKKRTNKQQRPGAKKGNAIIEYYISNRLQRSREEQMRELARRRVVLVGFTVFERSLLEWQYQL